MGSSVVNKSFTITVAKIENNRRDLLPICVALFSPAVLLAEMTYRSKVSTYHALFLNLPMPDALSV
jgi:hypothetical protein